MQDDRVEELVRELQELHIREAAIIAELATRTGTEPKESTDSDEGQRASGPRPGRPFVVGERVRIRNDIRKPTNWTGVWDARNKEAYRRAVVTAVEAGKVYLRNDLGIETWRAPKNLLRLH